MLWPCVCAVVFFQDGLLTIFAARPEKASFAAAVFGGAFFAHTFCFVSAAARLAPQVVLQALTLAASAAAVTFMPALAGILPVLKLIFTGEEDDEFSEVAGDLFASKLGEVLASIDKESPVDPAAAASAKGELPGGEAAYAARKDLADFFSAKKAKGKDDSMAQFFGLARFLAKEGVAYTTPGTPTWLCPDCARGLHPHDGSRTAQHFVATLERESRTQSYGMAFGDEDGKELEVLPVSRRQCLRVTQVTKKGPGDKAGVQKGDYILAIGGKFVSEFQDYTAVKFALTEGTQLDLKIERL